MNNSFKRVAGSMQQVQENQDGTLNGGFVSVTGGRYRVIIDETDESGWQVPGVTNGTAYSAEMCVGSNLACTNWHCKGSTNDENTGHGQQTCTNTWCLPPVPVTLFDSKKQSQSR